ncbi:MAG: signal peptide peptidase SppA [Elusimicrobia bacterium]|nr:signal peptide peptidase SppA [Elusimicrobiota bacterium]
MDEQIPTPGPEPVPGPVPDQHLEQHPAGARRIKRRLMYAVAGLYALSLGAGAILVLRGGGSGGDAKKKGGVEKGLMAFAEKDTVGWVPIHGVIMNSESGKPWERGAEQWARRIRALGEAPGVKAIVLDINSPGGSVGAVQEVYSAILRVRKEKKIPIVALFDDVSASGGYYIASACDKIVAHPGTLTGSIGVIFNVSNLEGLFSKIGYKSDPIKSGKYKDIGSPSRAMTKEERDLLQTLIMDAYGQFVAAVSTGRKIPEDEVRKLAQGQIYSGSQALQNKLVDMLGDSEDAIELAGKLGGISGKPKLRRDVEHISDIFDMLDSAFGGGLLGRSSLAEKLSPAVHYGLEYRAPGL